MFPNSTFRLGSFQQRHYNRAPIIEAIILLQFEMPSGFSSDELRGFAGIVAPEYVQIGEEREVQVILTPAGLNQSPAPITGFRFLNNESKCAIICRPVSFGLSKLAPYETWEAFRDEARLRWAAFRARFAPQKITSLSVRYINRIEIPIPEGQRIDFRWYFRTFPEISSDIDVGMAGFVLRADIPLQSIEARLVLNQAMLPPSSPKPEAVSVLLDSDIISNWDDQNDDAIWARFEELRKAKNDVFEASITNLARELFK